MESWVARLLFGLVYSTLLSIPLMVFLALPPAWREPNIVRVPAILYTIGVVILGSRWLALRAAQYSVVENRSFGDSFALALSDARFLLFFLPLVGRFFEPRK